MKKWLWLLGSLLVVGHAEAEIRVLFSFDPSGHFVHKIYKVADQQTGVTPSGAKAAGSAVEIAVSPIERGRSWKNAQVPEVRAKQQEILNRYVKLVWFDASGTELAQTEVPDPRVVHSPSHTEGFNASRNGLTEGAWLAAGPDSAVRVDISLPELPLLGLAAEFWTLDLIH